MNYEMHFSITESGEIAIAYKDEFREWLRRNAGKSGFAIFTAYTGKSTEQIKKYYFGYILEKVQHGFYRLGSRYKKEDVNRILKASYFKPIEDVGELNTTEWKDYIDFIIEYAATNLDTVISEAK